MWLLMTRAGFLSCGDENEQLESSPCFSGGNHVIMKLLIDAQPELELQILMKHEQTDSGTIIVGR